MSASVAAEAGLFRALDGIPRVDIARNLQIALAQGRHITSLLREVIALRRGAGRLDLDPAEYFYYKLWDGDLPMAEKRRFVGKQAQHPMHVACNSAHWYGPAADKILFHTIMTGEGLPLPELLAITQAGRHVRGGLPLTDVATVAAFLRQRRSTRCSPSRRRANTACASSAQMPMTPRRTR